MNKKRIKKFISATLALILLFSGINIKNSQIIVEAETAADSVSIDATSKTGNYGYSVTDENGTKPVGFRFRIVKGTNTTDGNDRYKGKRIDVYKDSPPNADNKYVVAAQIDNSVSRYAKTGWATLFKKQNKITKDNIKYIKTSKANNLLAVGTLFTFPSELNKESFESTFGKPSVQKNLATAMEAGDWDDLKVDHLITVEPIYEVKISYKTVYATPTDLAAIYYAYAGNTAGSVDDSGQTLQFIGRRVRLVYPVILYVPKSEVDGSDGKAEVKGIVDIAGDKTNENLIACSDIIQKSFGMGIIYDVDNYTIEPVIKIQYKVDPRFAIRNNDALWDKDPSGDGNVFRVFVKNENRRLGTDGDNEHYVYVINSPDYRLFTTVTSDPNKQVKVKSGKEGGMNIKYDNYHHTKWVVLNKGGAKTEKFIADGGVVSYDDIEKYANEDGVVTLQSVPEINKCYVQYKSDEKAEINNGENNGYGWSNTGYFITKNGNIHTTAINADKLNETKDDYYKWPGASSSVSLSTFDLKSGQWRKFDKWTDGEKRQNNENGEFVNGGTFTLSDSQRENARKSPSSSGSAGNVGWIVNPIRKYYPIALYAPENDKDARVHDLVGVADKVSYDGTYEDGSDKNHITNLFTKQAYFLQ